MKKNNKTINVSAFNYYSSIGKRTNNEDNYGVIPNEIFVVCDGVGGSQKGEKASEIVVDGILENYNKNSSISIYEVISEIEKKMTVYQNTFPESVGMSTTLVFLQNLKDSINIAWCGDSRVYQIRNGKIIYQTLDHSWVNEAVKAGIISHEEGINHPKRNVITRAIQGAHKIANIEETSIHNVMDNDYFLLCSDGVLESLNDDDIENLFNTNQNTESIIDAIKQACFDTSRDNNTAIVLKIKTEETIKKSRINGNYILLFISILVVVLYFVVSILSKESNKYNGSKEIQSIHINHIKNAK
jgi:protein phosphatase